MIYIQKRKQQYSGIAPNRRKILMSIDKWQDAFFAAASDRDVLLAMQTIENLESQL